MVVRFIRDDNFSKRGDRIQARQGAEKKQKNADAEKQL
jgi:hypothetical protein